MSDEVETDEEEDAKPSKLPLILGVVLALVGGGGGFYAASSGLILAPEKEVTETKEEEPVATDAPEIAFVPIDPVIVALPDPNSMRHLRFRAELEVPGVYQQEVENLMPRVINVLNTYLRALETRDFEHPAALFKIRAQLLNRINTVTGEGRVNDLLVMEYVIN